MTINFVDQVAFVAATGKGLGKSNALALAN
jgi:hypothetical protein